MERKAFPRGGALEDDHEEPRKKTDSHWLPTQKKKKSKKPRNDSESDPEADYEMEELLQKDAETKVTVLDLFHMSIQEKMKLLGRVSSIYDNWVEVCLPGSILATIPLHDIIEMIGISGADKYKNAPKLADIFKVDQLIISEVVKVVREKYKQTRGTSVCLSVNPKNIYEGKSHRDVAQTGCILQAFVRSVEDHGYILDCGIQDLHIFLNKKECVKYCSRYNGNPLVKGQIVRGVVIKAQTANVRSQVEVSIEPGKLFRAEKHASEHVDDVSQLLPGMRFKLEVTKRLSNGLAVNFDEFEGLVVDRNIPHKLKDLDVGDSIMGCLLYIAKPLNVPMFSLVHSVMDPTLAPVREFKYGDIVNSAVVQSECDGGVWLLLNKKTGTRGIVPRKLKRSAEREAISDAIHKVGNTVPCRVLEFDNLAETYVCTTLQSALKERFFSASDVPVGSFVTATVTGFMEKALTVSVGSVSGFIQWYHTADAPVSAWTDKYNVGQKIKGRVMMNNGRKVQVTAKEALLSKECILLQRYEDATPGKVYLGTVSGFRAAGLLVDFFGGVRGIIPYAMLTSAFKTLGQSNVGRLVKCTVLSCKDEQLFLAVKGATDANQVGVGFKCSPIVAGIDAKRRTLQVVSGTAIRGSIPAHHLHDNQKLAREIFLTYSIGDAVVDAICFTSKPVVFSTRGSVRRFFQSEQGRALAEKGAAELQPGVIIPCFVKSVGQQEVTLSTPLANSYFVHDVRVKESKDWDEGDYFPIRVRDAAEKTFDEDVLDSLGDKTQISADFLADILDGKRILEGHVKKSASLLGAYRVGDTVKGPVESTDSGFKVFLPNSVRGHVNCYCTDEPPTIGEMVEGKVIYIDYDRSELILSLQEAVKSKLLFKDSATNIEDGAVLSGKIIRGFSDFYLAIVTAPNGLRRAFIPKHVYPSRRAPLAVTPGAFGKDLEFLVVLKNGNDLVCVPTGTAGKWNSKQGTADVEDKGADEETCGEEKTGEEKKKRKRRKRKISASSDQSETRVVDNSSPKPPKDKEIAVPNSPKLSPKKLKNCPQKRLKDKSTKTIADAKKSHKKMKKLITSKTAESEMKKPKKLGFSTKSLVELPRKLENNIKLRAAFVESVTGREAKSPLVRSSDKTKKSLLKSKLGKNKLILKGVRKPAKRLKKAGKAKRV